MDALTDPRAVAERLATLGVPLSELTADSRSVTRGSVFLAYPGTARDGRSFIAEAISRGASAVVWESGGFAWDQRWENVPNVPVVMCRNARQSPTFASA